MSKDVEKAEVLQTQFCSVFTHEGDEPLPEFPSRCENKNNWNNNSNNPYRVTEAFKGFAPELKGKIQGRVEEQQLTECSQVLKSKIATKIMEPMMVKYQKIIMNQNHQKIS